MCNFRIGQRVRKVRGTLNVGRQGVVVGLELVRPGDVIKSYRGFHVAQGVWDIQVQYDGGDWDGQGGQVWPASQYANGIAAHFEPIVPDGHRSGDYSYTELMDRLKAGEVECV